MKFENWIPQICFYFLVSLLLVFIVALIGKNGTTYSFALKKEVINSEQKLASYEKGNRKLEKELNFWKNYPDLMKEEYLVSTFAMKKKTAIYFDYQNN